MTFHYGEAVRLNEEIRDFDQTTLLNPSTNTVYVYDSAGTLKQTFTTATKVSDGIYYVTYTIPDAGPAGFWYWIWKADAASLISKEKHFFEVEAI